MQKQISQDAINLIIEQEVSNEAIYNNHYIHPTWPQEESGVTIGIGYDCGYVTIGELHEDWEGLISDKMIAELESSIGIKGNAAAYRTKMLRGIVSVSWKEALSEFNDHEMPKWILRVSHALENVDDLSTDCLGSLVSLAYNRGISFNMPGNRYLEMRAICDHMKLKQFNLIPNELRNMKRLWPHTIGLRNRRDKEAELFEKGLKENI